MADSTGVQVFVGPVNQLELGTVTEGPTAVTLETVSDRLQRINFTIDAPSADLVAAAEGAQSAAANSEAAAVAAKTAAETAANSVTDAALNAAVLRVVTPGTLLIDTDGRPYIA